MPMFKKLLFGLLTLGLLISPAEAQRKTTILNLGSGKGIPLPVVNGECIIGVGTVAQWGACSGSGTAVTSVTGTAGQIAASPTTGDVILTLPNTITENLTFSGTHAITGAISGAGVNALFASPPVAIGTGTPVAITGTTGTFTGNLTTNITGGGTVCVHASNTGVLSGTAGDCGSGSGGITSLTQDVTASGTGAVAATVVRLQNRALAATAPTNNQALVWNTGNSDWEPTTLAGTGTVTNVTSSAPLSGSGTTTVALSCPTCVTSAASLTSNAVMTGAGSQASQTDTNATFIAGALTLGSSGTVGSITMGNGTSGTGFLKFPATGALGTSGITFPIGATDFSATGGASQVLKQIGAGAAITIGQEAFTDISGAATLAQLPTLLTNQVLGNSSGSTGAMSGQTIGAGLVMNAGGLQTTAADRTANGGATIAAGDMGGVINLTGTGNLVVPAISSTLLTTGMTVSYQNAGSGVITVSTTPTINALPHTAIPPGGFGTLVGNGSTLDWTGLSSPTATQIGGVMSVDCSSGGQFIQKINTDGTETCGTPAGGGNVSAAGTLTLHGVVLGAGTSAVSVTAVGTNGIPLIGQTGADPIYGTAVVAGGGTGAATLTAHGLLVGEGTGAIAALAAGTAGQLVASGGASADPGYNANAVLSGTGGQTLTLGANSGVTGTIVLHDINSSTHLFTISPGAGTTVDPTFYLPINAQASAQLLIPQGSNVSAWETVGGDCTMANTGSFTCTKTSGSAFGTAAIVNTGTSGATIPLLNAANTWSAVQTITQGDLALLGSSTGKTTLNSGLASSGNNTLTLPITATDTLAGLGTVQAWTAAQTFATVIGKTTVQSAAAYTLTAADCGTMVQLSNNTTAVVTIPNTLLIGCSISMEQTGTGTAAVSITGSAVTPATLHKAFTNGTSRVQYSVIGITIESGTGSNAVAVMWGDGA